MTREQAKELLPIIQAYADGKVIQWREPEDDEWYDYEPKCDINEEYDWRVKPEPKVRPFKNADECWNEMLKHQPFGWLNGFGNKILIGFVDDGEFITAYDGEGFSYNEALTEFTFVDGKRFGIVKE